VLPLPIAASDDPTAHALQKPSRRVHGDPDRRVEAAAAEQAKRRKWCGRPSPSSSSSPRRDRQTGEELQLCPCNSGNAARHLRKRGVAGGLGPFDRHEGSVAIRSITGLAWTRLFNSDQSVSVNSDSSLMGGWLRALMDASVVPSTRGNGMAWMAKWLATSLA